MLGAPLRVMRNRSEAKLPTKAHEGDLCFDFYAAEDAELRPGQTRVVDLGINLHIPEGFGLILEERSGLASRGVVIGAGVIDNHYRGPLKAVVRWLPDDAGFDEELARDGDCPPRKLNYMLDNLSIKAGDKIVQGRLVHVIDLPIQEVTEEEFSTDTVRAESGFGSTGV